MKPPRRREFGELLAALCDGTLSAEDSRQLNDILKTDPISQEQCLDHLMLEGLLERELGEGPPGGIDDQPGRRGAITHRSSDVSVSSEWERRLFRGRLMGAAAALAAVAAFVVLSSTFMTRSRHHTLDLVNSGFESMTPIFMEALGEGASWYGDEADVVEEYSGVTPIEGKRMVRFIKSSAEPDNMCELYQLVDLDEELVRSSHRSIAVEASALFNAIPENGDAEGCTFGVAIYAYPDSPATRSAIWPLLSAQPLSFGGRQTQADADVESWQEVKATLELPRETRYLVIQLSAMREDGEDGEFPGQFADRAAVRLAWR